MEQVGDEGPSHGAGWPLQSGWSRGIQGGQGGVASAGAADAPTLLRGNHRLFAATYVTSGAGAQEMNRSPRTDRRFGDHHLGGEGRGATATIIRPAMNGETVTIDVPDETEELAGMYSGNLHPFRFLDVPVQ